MNVSILPLFMKKGISCIAFTFLSENLKTTKLNVQTVMSLELLIIYLRGF